MELKSEEEGDLKDNLGIQITDVRSLRSDEAFVRSVSRTAVEEHVLSDHICSLCHRVSTNKSELKCHHEKDHCNPELPLKQLNKNSLKKHNTREKSKKARQKPALMSISEIKSQLFNKNCQETSDVEIIEEEKDEIYVIDENIPPENKNFIFNGSEETLSDFEEFNKHTKEREIQETSLDRSMRENFVQEIDSLYSSLTDENECTQPNKNLPKKINPYKVNEIYYKDKIPILCLKKQTSNLQSRIAVAANEKAAHIGVLVPVSQPLVSNNFESITSIVTKELDCVTEQQSLSKICRTPVAKNKPDLENPTYVTKIVSQDDTGIAPNKDFAKASNSIHKENLAIDSNMVDESLRNKISETNDYIQIFEITEKEPTNNAVEQETLTSLNQINEKQAQDVPKEIVSDIENDSVTNDHNYKDAQIEDAIEETLSSLDQTNEEPSQVMNRDIVSNCKNDSETIEHNNRSAQIEDTTEEIDVHSSEHVIAVTEMQNNTEIHDVSIADSNIALVEEVVSDESYQALQEIEFSNSAKTEEQSIRCSSHVNSDFNNSSSVLDFNQSGNKVEVQFVQGSNDNVFKFLNDSIFDDSDVNSETEEEAFNANNIKNNVSDLRMIASGVSKIHTDSVDISFSEPRDEVMDKCFVVSERQYVKIKVLNNANYDINDLVPNCDVLENFNVSADNEGPVKELEVASEMTNYRKRKISIDTKDTNKDVFSNVKKIKIAKSKKHPVSKSLDPKLEKCYVSSSNPYAKTAKSFRRHSSQVKTQSGVFSLEREIALNKMASKNHPYCKICLMIREHDSSSDSEKDSVSTKSPKFSEVWISATKQKSTLQKCKTCHLVVHSACYKFQTDNDNCDRCSFINKNPEAAVNCKICDKNSGALKKYLDNFYHVRCQLLIPELNQQTNFNLEAINKKRYLIQCDLCEQVGTEPVVHCNASVKCLIAFHPSCAEASNVDTVLNEYGNPILRCKVCIEIYKLKLEDSDSTSKFRQDLILGEKVKILNHPGYRLGIVTEVLWDTVYFISFQDGTSCDHVDPEDVTFPENEKEALDANVTGIDGWMDMYFYVNEGRIRKVQL